MNFIVYLIRNRVNGKFYVGQTSYSLRWRWLKHLSSGRSPHLYSAVQKYGASNFQRCVLCFCSTEKEALLKEIFYIHLLDSNNPRFGYNLTEGGEGRRGPGIPLSRKARKHLSLVSPRFWLGKKLPEEARRKMSLAKIGKPWNHRGHKHSVEARAKLRRAWKLRRLKYDPPNKGRKLSKSWRRNISAALIGNTNAQKRSK